MSDPGERSSAVLELVLVLLLAAIAGLLLGAGVDAPLPLDWGPR